MKWFVAFLVLLLLGHGHLLFGPDIIPAILGFPGWIYYYILVHCLFIFVLSRYSKSIQEEEL